MFWKKLWEFLCRFWKRINIFKTSSKTNTTLDTAKLSMFGLNIEVTRELPADIPYELTIVVPRAEYRNTTNENKCDCRNLEIILNSITIAHSPRFERQGGNQHPPVPISNHIVPLAPTEITPAHSEETIKSIPILSKHLSLNHIPSKAVAK